MEHFFSRLENTITSYWDSPAICNFEGETFTYSAIATSMAQFHVLFEHSGISRGDRIAICARNSARWAISFLSITTYGAVAVPILSDFLPGSVAHLTDHSESVLLFTDPDIWAKINPESVPGIKGVVSVNDFTLLYSRDDVFSAAFSGLQENFAKKFPMGFTRANVNYAKDTPEDLMVINYTSGTTSAPKGVMLRGDCFSATIQFAGESVPIHYGDNVVSMLPMGHIYGLVFEFLFPFCNGVCITYFGKTPSPTLLLKAMKAVKPVMVVTVPLVMEKIHKTSIAPVVSKLYMKILLHLPFIGKLLYRKMGQRLMEAFGGKVQYFIMGGAALNPTVEKTFKRMGIPYTVGYGMTEASPLLTWAHPDEYVPGSCGKPISCISIRIDSEDPQHTPGEIQAKGMNIFSGYYRNDDANLLAFTEDGFFKTGDLGVMDQHGNVFIRGRIKNMILSANGQNIYPEEVEAVVNDQQYVLESVVVDRASKLVALINLDNIAVRMDKLDREAVSDIPENVRESANRRLPSYSKITKVEVIDEPFEKTPKMSIKRFLYK